MPRTMDFFSVRMICAFLLFGLALHATNVQAASSGDEMVRQILSDVVDETAQKAEEVVRQTTGIDINERGFQFGKEHEPMPREASEESRRELQQLKSEHDRKINNLQEELDRKLSKAREEFSREAAKEDKPEKTAEKRDKLEEKVHKAYDKFDEKVREENARFDEKRGKIVERAKEKGERGKGKDRGRGKGND